MRAKGISVDLEALKAEYISQHRGAQNYNSSSDDNDEDDPIDVVGGTTDESTDCHSLQQRLDCSNDNNLSNRMKSTNNIFSIERILCKNSSWDFFIQLVVKKVWWVNFAIKFLTLQYGNIDYQNWLKITV